MFAKLSARTALAAVLVAGTAALAASPASAQSTRRVQVGTLECLGSPSVSFIIGSRRTFNCTFRTPNGRFPYEGTINRWGLDVGVTGANVLLWSVLAPTKKIDGRRDLTGSYAGVSGSVAVGLGVAGNALVGGSNNTIALQPLSVEAQTGVNLAVGVSSFRLRSR